MNLSNKRGTARLHPLPRRTKRLRDFESVQGISRPIQTTKPPFRCKDVLLPQIPLRLPRNFGSFLADCKTLIFMAVVP
jgi:hypothetical protein